MKQIKFIHTLIFITILLLAFPMLLLAAKFPNAVEREFEIREEAAKEIADLFELKAPSEKGELKLDEGTAWAAYLLKQDTSEELSNSNKQPSRYNKIEFNASSEPTIKISPYWLDHATRLPNPRAYYYSFNSDSLSLGLSEDTLWAKAVRNLKKHPDWNGECRSSSHRGKMIEINYQSLNGSVFTITVYCHEIFPNNIATMSYLVELGIETKDK